MPDPVLIAIATTLASKSATSLYHLVKKKFAQRTTGPSALDAAAGAVSGSPTIDALATQLADAEQEDPTFANALRAEWAATQTNQTAADDGTTNQIRGTVTGPVVQARDIGSITFGS